MHKKLTFTQSFVRNKQFTLAQNPIPDTIKPLAIKAIIKELVRAALSMKVPIISKYRDKVKIRKNHSSKKALVFGATFAVIGAALTFRIFAATSLTLDTTLPVPQNVRAYPDDRNIIVTWDKVSDSRVVGYYLTYRVAGSSDEFKVRQTIHDQIQLQPMTNGTEYEIYVQSASGYIMKTSTGSLVPSAGQNNWRRGDGKVSNKTTVLKATPTTARVDAMRQRLTGFFDDFNDPAGPFDELLWNQAPMACVAPYTAAAFINSQFHAHNMARSSYCDRGGMATRPRATFDVTGASPNNPAMVEMDTDGGNNHRNVWYIDFVPLTARKNSYPLDITSHNDLFHLDKNDPGNILRLNHGVSGEVKMIYYDSNRNSRTLTWEGSNRACPSWSSVLADYCNFSNKTAGISPIAQNQKPNIVPNVRKHWAVHFTGTKAQLYIDGSFFGEVTLPADFAAQKKFTVHSTIFSYNTGKESEFEGDKQITPYIYLMHWDNFGFSGPAPTEVIHNYLEGGASGNTVVYGRGSENYTIPKGNRTTIIPVPDQIGTLKDGKGALYMTLNEFDFSTYTWAPGDHIVFNGTRYDVPNPATIVNSPMPTSYCDQYSTSITPFSFVIPINQTDIRQGNNTVTFNLSGQSNGCNSGAADVMNVHLELPYDKNNPNIPTYTKPSEIFGQQFRAIVEPPLTTCDSYKFIEQDLGLPYESGKVNLDIGNGECVLMEGHNSSTPNPGPVDPPANVPPTINLSSSTTSTTAPASFSVSAVASDSDGSVTKIEIKENSTVVQTCNNTTNCTYNATNKNASTLNYTATATDDDSATTNSATVTITVNEPTTPPASSFFDTLPVNATLPSETECAARVKPRAEIRPSNQVPNNTRGIGSNYSYPGVTGNYTGTTDEIIQWAACKWGMNEDILRAQMVQESAWFQSAIGDFTNTESACSNVYPLGNYPPQYNGDSQHNNQCPESYGLSQVRWGYHKSAFYSDINEIASSLTNNAIYSTAYNVDYWGAVWRTCYNGDFPWLNTVERGQDYVAGDVWGCLGAWFSGRWYTDPAVTYINNVQNNLSNRAWEQSWFLNLTPVNTIPGTGPSDTTPPIVSITSPANNATVSGTVSIATTATDNVGVSRVSYFLDGSSTAFSNDSSAPYTSSWNSATVSNGNHTIKAVATDTSGNVAESTITINVQNVTPDTTAPTTSITSPTNGAKVNGTITIQANASDNVGVSRVNLQIDGQYAASDLTSPYSFLLDTTILSEGNHELRTRAYDAAGNNTYSAIVTIVVDNIVDPTPEVCEDPEANNTGGPLPCTYDEPSGPVDPTPVPGDADGDGVVDRTDLRIAKYYYRSTVDPFTNGDMDGDGYVDRDDIRVILYYYRSN